MHEATEEQCIRTLHLLYILLLKIDCTVKMSNILSVA